MFKAPQSLKVPKAIVHAAVTQRMHFLAKQPFGEGADTTLLWTANIPVGAGVRKRMLIFKNMQYVISNWAEAQYPLVIYICVDGINGYMDKIMAPTTRVAALQIQNAYAVIDDSGVRTYELRYQLKDSSFWEIPDNVTQINVRLQVDEITQSVVLPLPNPLLLNIQVRTQ